MRILWLRPSTGENVSVRRERIAEKLEQKGVEVDIVDASGLDALSAIATAISGNYDVIAGNVRIGLYIGYPIAKILGKPFLGDVSDTLADIENLPSPLFELLAEYEWFVLKRADASVFVYQSSLEEAKERGIQDAIKLPNAVNYEMFASPDQRVVTESRNILESSGVDFQKPMAIYIGIFTDNYHIKDIVNAARSTPEWEFVFVGEGERFELINEAQNDLDNVYYPGAFEYRLMPGFLSQADVGFCFKDAEQPLKLKEYGAAGIPAIVQPGELSDWYEEDELVFVEPDRNRISEVLGQLEDKKVRKEYGENLREVAKEYRWEDIAKGYFDIFQKISK